MRILVLDDEVQIRELLHMALGANGHEVITVPTVEQALSELAAKPFDLVILDLSVPGGSGESVLEMIRKSHSTVPVVIYSGYVTPEKEVELRKAGANEVLHKDVRILTLVRQVETILKAKDSLFCPSEKAKQKSILIVDDERPIRDMLKAFFRTKGIQTLEAENGLKAVELARMAKPSVALLDMNMPGMNGLETLKKLKENDPSIGVVMVTGEAEDGLVQEAMKLGAYGYVLKPFDFLYLELTVMSKLIIAGHG